MLRLLLTTVLVFSAGAPGAAFSQEGPCERLAETSREARSLMTSALEALPDDIEKMIVDGGVAMLDDPRVRESFMDMLRPFATQEDAHELEYFEATFAAIPALERLSVTAAVMSTQCPSR